MNSIYLRRELAPSFFREERRILFTFLFIFLCSLSGYSQTDDVQMQDTLQEVIVTTEWAKQRVKETQIGVEKVDVRTMSRLPAMFGERDIIKGLQLLPGVKSEADGLGGYQVRGGTSSQNNILLDGAAARPPPAAALYNDIHAALQLRHVAPVALQEVLAAVVKRFGCAAKRPDIVGVGVGGDNAVVARHADWACGVGVRG